MPKVAVTVNRGSTDIEGDLSLTQWNEIFFFVAESCKAGRSSDFLQESLEGKPYRLMQVNDFVNYFQKNGRLGNYCRS